MPRHLSEYLLSLSLIHHHFNEYEEFLHVFLFFTFYYSDYLLTIYFEFMIVIFLAINHILLWLHV